MAEQKGTIGTDVEHMNKTITEFAEKLKPGGAESKHRDLHNSLDLALKLVNRHANKKVVETFNSRGTLQNCVQHLVKAMDKCFEKKLESERPLGPVLLDTIVSLVKVLDVLFPEATPAKRDEQPTFHALNGKICRDLKKCLLKGLRDNQYSARLNKWGKEVIISVFVMNLQHTLTKQLFEKDTEAIETFTEFYDCIAIESQDHGKKDRNLAQKPESKRDVDKAVKPTTSRGETLIRAHKVLIDMLDKVDNRAQLWNTVATLAENEDVPYVEGLFSSLSFLADQKYKDLAVIMLAYLGFTCLNNAQDLAGDQHVLDVFKEEGGDQAMELWSMLAHHANVADTAEDDDKAIPVVIVLLLVISATT